PPSQFPPRSLHDALPILMVRELEREHIPLCKRFGLGVLPWSPLAAGFLSGKYAKNQPPPSGVRLEKWKERFAGYDNDRGWRTLRSEEHTSELQSRVDLVC